MAYDTIDNDVTMPGGGNAALGRIDQYELLRELGGGGFGSVYLARDTVAGIEVAVKGLPPMIRNNAEELERIRENFALVSRLHHPYIAAALHLQRANDVYYGDESTRQKLRVLSGDTLMVMEYAPGVTLSQWRRQFPGGRVPLEVAIQIVWQVAQALDYAHEQHIIHRDVKPSNVMVETKPDGEVVARILDFGLAAEIRSSMGRVSREVRDTSGTRPYMAPEQWAGRKQGPATDQYALAAMFYELLTGEVPFASVFETGDPVVMMTAVCNREVEFPEDCPRQAALRRALSKDPEQRFATCMDFLEAAAKSERSSEQSASPVSKVPAIASARRVIIVKATCAVALAVAVLAGGYYAWAKYGGQIPQPHTASSIRSTPSKADPNSQIREEHQKAVSDLGQKLKVPAETVVPDAAPAAPTTSSSSPKAGDTNIVAVSNEHAISSSPEEVAPPKPAVRKFKPYTGPTREYVVRAGDTFLKIARGNGITLPQLVQLNNGLNVYDIQEGQKLRVPSRKVISNAVPASSTTSSLEEETTYIVQMGDNLSFISKKFGVTVSSIKQLNSMKSEVLRVGQKLKIPGKNNADTTRPVTNVQRQALLDQRIQALLDQRNNEAEQRQIAAISQAYYEKWNRPEWKPGMGNMCLQVWFGQDGTVKSYNLTGKSGYPDADASVLNAAMCVERVPVVYPAFFMENKVRTVRFTVTEP